MRITCAIAVLCAAFPFSPAVALENAPSGNGSRIQVAQKESPEVIDPKKPIGNYSGVYQVRPGCFTWKRLSDGAVHVPCYATEDEAFDVLMSEIGSEPQQSGK
jgi:hypothetical protein